MFNNIKNILGFPEEQYDDDYEVYDPEAEETDFSAASNSTQYESGNTASSNNRHVYQAAKSKQGEKTMSNVVGMPGITNSNAEVSVITPRSFDTPLNFLSFTK